MRDRVALVVGLGRSGESAARFLAGRGARVGGFDVKAEAALGAQVGRLQGMGVRLWLGEAGRLAELCGQADLIVVSPGVDWNLPPLAEARARGIEVVGEVELAAPFLQGSVIGVTGANGKTTTTVLIGHLLGAAGFPVQVGGNIGPPYPPVTDLVATSSAGGWSVLELSSFQLEAIQTFRAHIAAALNVTPDHLDRHGSFERYAAAKGRLFSTQRAGDFAVLNRDDTTCRGYARQTAGQVAWFSRWATVSPGAFVREGWIVFRDEAGETRLAEAASVPLRGAHNLENALAAAAAAFLAGAPAAAIAQGLASFRAVEHRLEFVRRLEGVDYYNDSKATNVDATRKALEAFESNLWVILGGLDKGSDYTVLRELLSSKAKGALLVGSAAPKIGEQLAGAVSLLPAGTVEEALRLAWGRAEPGDTVLLAPACASFDQFDNYEHRGRVFKQRVLELEPRESKEGRG